MNAKPDRDDRPEPSKKSGTKSGAGKSGDSVSRVLKTVYDDTLREDIPDEFRDLLSKLG